MRRLNLRLNRLLWLSAALAITALALMVPLSAAIFSRRAASVHSRSLVSRSVQTSRLGISGDAIEDGVGGVGSSSVLLRSQIDHDTDSLAHASLGAVPHIAGYGLSAFAWIPAALFVSAQPSFGALAAPRGPPTA